MKKLVKKTTKKTVEAYIIGGGKKCSCYCLNNVITHSGAKGVKG